LNPDVEADELEEMLGEFAGFLLENNTFIYKGMETAKVNVESLQLCPSSIHIF
jgi:hypothetical protein